MVARLLNHVNLDTNLIFYTAVSNGGFYYEQRSQGEYHSLMD